MAQMLNGASLMTGPTCFQWTPSLDVASHTFRKFASSPAMLVHAEEVELALVPENEAVLESTDGRPIDHGCTVRAEQTDQQQDRMNVRKPKRLPNTDMSTFS